MSVWFGGVVSLSFEFVIEVSDNCSLENKSLFASVVFDGVGGRGGKFGVSGSIKVGPFLITCLRSPELAMPILSNSINKLSGAIAPIERSPSEITLCDWSSIALLASSYTEESSKSFRKFCLTIGSLCAIGDSFIVWTSLFAPTDGELVAPGLFANS